MNSQEQFLLSTYLIKAAMTGAIIRGGGRAAGRSAVKGVSKKAPILSPAEQQLKKTLSQLTPNERQVRLNTQLRKNLPASTPASAPAALPAPSLGGYAPPPVANFSAPSLAAVAPSVAGPQGLSLARQGLGQLTSGVGQAARAGLGAARTRIGAGLNTARTNLATVARNPIAQAGAVGLGAGILGGAGGAYLMNRNTGGAAQAPEAASADNNPYVAEATQTATPGYATAVNKLTAGANADTPSSFLEQANPYAATQTPNAPATAAGAVGGADTVSPTAEPDYSAVFSKYMGDYNPQSTRDQAKMEYLKSLNSRGLSLNAANIYDREQGYGNF